jgi:ketosteroid isomerase-like protein
MQRLLVVILLLLGTAFAQNSASPQCSAPEYHQFDFWLGDWNAYDAESPKVVAARVRVEPILDGCSLHEIYDGVNGLHGESFSIYDESRKLWHQTWVTNRGQLLVVEGSFAEGAIKLSGVDNARHANVVAAWKQENGGVRETAFFTDENGKGKRPWFDMIFRPHSPAGSAQSDDAKTINALDTEYQAAVARNDVVTMDRLLADGFILISSKGKTYTKQDLLEEARSGRIHYDRQDDSEQTVRVFGDTAIITAKLFAKGEEGGKPFEYTLWFSDTYSRTPSGWKYVFGQAAGRL